MSIKERLKHKYALSEQGANDMIKAVIVVTIANLAFSWRNSKFQIANVYRGNGCFRITDHHYNIFPV